MTINRVPIFVWSILSMAFMVLFAVPAVTLATSLLELDRLFGTGFFVPHLGGSTRLHLHGNHLSEPVQHALRQRLGDLVSW